ncbi:MAG: hypothetical protein P8Y54_10850 [Xanthomonadales bacterium]
MKEEVRSIIQVTDAHQEYDVRMRNECPGAVYWSTCIERMDPWTYRILETHTPGGYVEAGKRARVNLHLKNTPPAGGDLADGRIQAVYVSYAYAIDGPPRAACVAQRCEAKKSDLRAQVTANDKAWLQARQRLAARIESECPTSGWGNADVDACRDQVRAAGAEELQAFADTDAALQAKLAEIDPENCTVYGGHANAIR